MKLESILAQKGSAVHTAYPQDLVVDAARKLVALNIGALAVVDTNGTLIGIISERDILRLTSQNPGSMASIRVESYMTSRVFSAVPEETVDDCLGQMNSRRIRHMPVISNGKLVGMVSQGDLVKVKIQEAEFETAQLTNYVKGQYPG